MVCGTAGESHLLSIAVLLPLATHQPELDLGTYCGPRCLRPDDCRSPGSRRAPGAADLRDRAPRDGGHCPDIFTAARPQWRRPAAAPALRPALRPVMPVGNSRLPRR